VHDPLYRYLRRRAPVDAAEEVMGDVLLTLWRRIDDIPSDGELPWCYAVARRALSNNRRRAGRYLRLVERLQSQPHDHIVEGAVDFPELASALESLSPGERELVTLWAWDGLEPREIAVVLDTTANAVSLRLARIKDKISREMDRQTSLVAGHKKDGRAGEQTI
jgi:RNA polymerase sigma-70 factor (ECF subfamily)